MKVTGQNKQMAQISPSPHSRSIHLRSVSASAWNGLSDGSEREQCAGVDAGDVLIGRMELTGAAGVSSGLYASISCIFRRDAGRRSTFAPWPILTFRLSPSVSVCLSLCPSVCLPIHSFSYPSLCFILFIRFVCPFMRLCLCLSLHVSINAFLSVQFQGPAHRCAQRWSDCNLHHSESCGQKRDKISEAQWDV